MAGVYKAKLNDIDLDIETVEDSFDKAVARYEFPYRNGALLEDMGRKARSIKIRCYFYGAGYERHRALVTTLDSAGDVQLIHPRYGMIKGVVEAVSVRHDDRLETAEVDVTIVENTPAPEPARAPDVASQLEDSYERGLREAGAELAGDMAAALGLGAGDLLTRELDPGKGIFEQFQDLAGGARAFVSQVDEYVRSFESALNDIANPANSLVATMTYAADLPGRVIGAVAATMERYSLLYDSLKSAPTRFIQSFREGIAQLKESLPGSSKNAMKQSAIGIMRKHLQIAAAQRGALDMAAIYRSDEEKRQKVRRMESRESFDLLGNYVKTETVESILTVDDIEKSLAEARTELQTAVESARSLQSLKDMAAQLLFHVNTIKLEREKIVTVDLDNETPLHLVCLKYGLPYNMAERIHAINAIRNPNFASGTLSIYAR